MIVYTGGTFDLFHSGHVNFLRQCKLLADKVDPFITLMNPAKIPPRKLIVSLNSDKFIKDFKGKAPIYSYDERETLLRGCRYVDDVILNIDGADSRKAIESVMPDIIAIGSDWAKKDYYKQMGFTQDWLDEKDIMLVYIPYTEGISSSELKRRIIE